MKEWGAGKERVSYVKGANLIMFSLKPWKNQPFG